MTRSLWSRPALFTLFITITALLTACHRNENNGPLASAPTITSFSPEKGNEGSTVEITGTHFSTTKENNNVKFGDLLATVVDATITKLTVTVPENAATGKISVTIDGKTATSSKDFTIDLLAPVITTFSPDKGAEGTTLTITGTNFKAGTKVYVGTKEATDVVVVSKTQITAKVAAGSSTDKVKIVGPNGEAMSSTYFYLPPAIASITTSAEEGQEVTITGTNFSDVATDVAISFGGGAATTAEVVSVGKTEIKVKAPVAGQNGKITVTVAGQTATSTDDFNYKSTITDFMPKHGERGSEVTLTGKRFSDNPLVVMNDITMHINSKSATEIKFTITEDDAVVGDKITLKGNGTYQTSSAFEVTNIWQGVSASASFSFNYQAGTSFVYNNKLYIGLGVTTSTIYNTNFSVFDSEKNTWEKAFDVPTGFAGRIFPFSVVKGNKLYIGGGTFSDGTKATDFWEFDLVAGTWKQEIDLKSPTSNAIAFVLNDKIYIGTYNPTIGGNRLLNEFDPLAGTQGAWLTSYDINNTASQGVFTFNNKEYYIGDPGTPYLYAFDPTSDSYNTGVGNLPFNPNSLTSFSVNGQWYYLETTYNIFYTYKPSINEWIQLTNIPFVNGSSNKLIYSGAINNKVYASSSKGQIFKYIPNY